MKSNGDGLFLSALGCNVEVQCEDVDTRMLLETNYGALVGSKKKPQLKYVAGRQNSSCAFFIKREGQRPLRASDDSELLYFFEQDLTIELQKFRRDLYFLHAAVVEFADKAFILTGPSGSGKSITTWALLQHGFLYLSDELGPVDLRTMEVHGYPHALCLKDQPPPRYPLPEKTLYASSTIHIPVETMRGRVPKMPRPLAAIFFLSYSGERFEPVIRPVSKAEAGARIFTNALNPLAHPDDGLEAALDIAKETACFELFSGNLSDTCALIKNTLENILGSEEGRAMSCVDGNTRAMISKSAAGRRITT